MNLDLTRFLPEALRALRNHRYETDAKGQIHIQRAGFFIGGFFRALYTAPGDSSPLITVASNRVVNPGLNKVLNLLGGHVASAPLYIAGFTEDVEPQAGWTATDFVNTANEFTAYTPSTRVPWTTVASTAQSLSNAAALAGATITLGGGGPHTIRGAGLLEGSVKESVAGPLIAAARFDADLTGMPAGGKIAYQYDLAALDESDA